VWSGRCLSTFRSNTCRSLLLAWSWRQTVFRHVDKQTRTRLHGVMTSETTRIAAVESWNIRQKFIVEMVYVAVAWFYSSCLAEIVDYSSSPG
jgi:hypothetical protein